MTPKIKYPGGHFPNDKQLLLLKASLHPSPENAKIYFNQWLQAYGLENLDTSSKTFLLDFMDSLDLGSQRTLPLVIYNLGENAHPYFKFLIGTRKNYWVRNKQISYQIQRVQKILEQNNIPNMIIKGADLLARYYSDKAICPMNDGDILIPTEYRKQVQELAINGFFDNKIPTYDYYMRDFFHAIHLILDGGVDIDLHWCIFSEYYSDINSSDFIWRDAQNITIDNSSKVFMSDTHAFFVSLVHGRKFEATPPIRWVTDTVTIYRKAKNIDWTEILTLTQRFNFKPFIKKALPFLRQEFDVQIPDEILVLLEKMPVPPLEEKYYQSVTKEVKNRDIINFIWFLPQQLILFYKLFLKNKGTSLSKYLISWYYCRLKAEIFKKEIK